jgi:serine/tyrosine/threonine adenylyltransferase
MKKFGFKLDYSYSKLPSFFFTRISPKKVESPKVLLLNSDLAKLLDLDFSLIDESLKADFFSGNILPPQSIPISQAYAGHQFGNLSILGDGRAVLIGEHTNASNEKFDVQLKGSGTTPYSRNGDGRASLSPMLREYLISEAMYFLNIPTTRSLAVTSTGEKVFREKAFPGAILTRIASSHIRVGTFQYAAFKGSLEIQKKLLDYTINRHFKDIKDIEYPGIQFLKSMMLKQIDLTINWMRVGFIHGVMNTDNMSINGETIDYGPCAFMDSYNPSTCFSSIDFNKRYSFQNQKIITQWNLARFAETLIPFLDKSIKKSVNFAQEIIESFDECFSEKWKIMMKCKLGILNSEKGDNKIISDLLSWMEKNSVDYTNTFCHLISEKKTNDPIYNSIEFNNWYKNWKNRIKRNNKPITDSFKLMKNYNPRVIPRNHIVEESLIAFSENNDPKSFNELIKILSDPYNYEKNIKKKYTLPNLNKDYFYETFCGT